MRMDEYVIIICMLGCGGKYNNMWGGKKGATVDAPRPMEKREK